MFHYANSSGGDHSAERHIVQPCWRKQEMMDAIQKLIDRCEQDATTLAMENWLRQTKEAQAELAALRAAGNAMAKALASLQSSERWDEDHTAALHAWEKAID